LESTFGIGFSGIFVIILPTNYFPVSRGFLLVYATSSTLRTLSFPHLGINPAFTLKTFLSFSSVISSMIPFPLSKPTFYIFLKSAFLKITKFYLRSYLTYY
jgi:hypothetical protein